MRVLFFVFCMLMMNVYAATGSVHIKLLKLADTNTVVPHGYNFYTKFNAPYLLNGKVAFHAFYAKNSNEGVFSNLGGELEITANRKTKMPGARTTFRTFGSDVALSKNNVAFWGYGRRRTQNYSGIYNFTNGKILPVADNSTVIPGGKNRGIFINVSQPVPLSNGETIFIGEDSNFNLAIYAGKDQKHLRLLLGYDVSIPFGKGKFTNIYQFAVSQSNLSYDDFIFLGKGKGNQVGMYLYHKGKISMLVNQNTKIPNGVGFFKGINKLCYDSKNNQVAFIGEGVIGQQGIYLYNIKTKKIIKIADQETFVPDETDRFNEFFNLSLADGEIIFGVRDENQERGVYLYNTKGIFKVISDHDLIDKKAISDFALSSSALNKDLAAMIIKFKDGTSAVYLVKLSYSPY